MIKPLEIFKVLTPISPAGIRKIDSIDLKKLRLFFLSLLWRAAATNLPEFSEITLPKDDLEQLRLMLLSDDPDPSSFYPIALTQLSTVGVIHNQSPFADIMHVPSIMDTKAYLLPTYRFYFDGLIAHIHRPNSNQHSVSGLGSLIIGSDNELIISTQTYEQSFQRENLIVTTNKFL